MYFSDISRKKYVSQYERFFDDKEWFESNLCNSYGDYI